jgi:VanZ family protein
MFIFRYWKPIVWSVLILIASGISGNRIPDMQWALIPHKDKIAHFIMYLVFAFLLISSLYQANFPRKKPSSLFITSFLVSMAYGVLMEILQELVFISRSFDLVDIAVNILGTFTGLLLYIIYRRSGIRDRLIKITS